MVRPVPTPASVVETDIWVMAGVSGLFIAFLVTGWRINRIEGAVLLALYIGYMISLASG